MKKYFKNLGLALLGISLSTFGLNAHGEEALWDLGLGVAAVHIPDYIGSDEARDFALPFPYFVYRGEKLKIDRNAAHGILFEQDDWRAEWNFSGSPPVESSDNDARTGMSDLDAIIEVGPSLMYTLARSDNYLWRLELPVRKATSTDFRQFDDRGWSAMPQLRFNRRFDDARARWLLEMVAGPVYGSADYHDYIYGVDAKYAHAERPEYHAASGFGGWRLALGASRRVKNVWAGAFLRYMVIDDAVFEGSALVREHESLMFGFAVAWIFHSSDKSAREWCVNENSDFSDTC